METIRSSALTCVAFDHAVKQINAPRSAVGDVRASGAFMIFRIVVSFRQDEFVRRGDAESVAMPIMNDRHFPLVADEVTQVDLSRRRNAVGQFLSVRCERRLFPLVIHCMKIPPLDRKVNMASHLLE
jgi:hypothetical protein